MGNGSFVINETNIGFRLEAVRTCELCSLHGVEGGAAPFLHMKFGPVV